MLQTRISVFTGLCLAVTAAAAVPVDSSAQSFEGVVTFHVHNGERGQDGTIVQTTKGHKVRLDMTGMGAQGQSGSMIYDGDGGSTTILLHDQKMYMTSNRQTAEAMRPLADSIKKLAEKYKQAHPDSSANDEAGEKVHFTKTGRTETVAGVNCDVYHGYSESNGKREEGDVCVAKGVGFEMMNMMASAPRGPMSAGRAAMNPAWQQFRQLLKDDQGVVKITAIKNGAPEVELVATSIQRKSVGDNVFQAPPDYKPLNFGGMMGRPQKP